MPRGVAELIVSRLREAGVRGIFGMPGGGSTLDLIEAAGGAGLPFILTATETGGALAAMAQAEISGRPGACVTALGPGVSSVVNGVACAHLDRAPLVVLTDSHPASANGIFGHQRIDHRALLAPVTKSSSKIDAENADEVLARSIALAMAPPPGPVHIDIPADAAVATVEGPFQRREGGDLERVALPNTMQALLVKSRRPIMLIGLGARAPADADAIRSLCASHNVPAMVTYKAKGVVPDHDPHFAGVFTNGAIERTILEQADLLIALGLDPVELIPRPWTYTQPVIYSGPWAVDERHLAFAARWITDVAAAVPEIAERLPRADWDLDAIGREVAGQRQRLCPATDALAAHRVVQIAADAATTARVTVDAGAHMFPATMLWPVAEPSGMLISNGLSTMGFALPAAIGAALLDRTRPVVALTGDGGLLMCAGELLTAARERLRIVTIVFNDGSLSLIEIKQRQRQFAASGMALGEVAWCALAESLGVAARLATSESELEHALARALDADGPALIEARIDPSTYADALRSIRG